MTLKQAILEGQDGINHRLKHCCVAHPTTIITKVLSDFLPFQPIEVVSDEVNEDRRIMVVSLPFDDYPLTFKFTMQKRECGWFVQNIENATLE